MAISIRGIWLGSCCTLKAFCDSGAEMRSPFGILPFLMIVPVCQCRIATAGTFFMVLADTGGWLVTRCITKKNDTLLAGWYLV